MSQNFPLLHVSNLSVRNFRILCSYCVRGLCLSRAAVASVDVIPEEVAVGAVGPREHRLEQTTGPGQVKPVLVTDGDGRKLKQGRGRCGVSLVQVGLSIITLRAERGHLAVRRH